MIAHVVPIVRLRRDTTWWSYRIPTRISCAPGSLVVIPFRGRKELGIVWDTLPEDEQATEAIEEILVEKPLLTLPHRQVVESLSQYGLCSLSTALYLWLPAELRGFPLTKHTRALLHTFSSTAPTSAAQHCILAPAVKPLLHAGLTKKFQDHYSNLFGTTFKLDEWLDIATGTITVALGRERALFAPWHNLRKITILDPEDISYYHEQAPYLSLLEIASSLQKYTRSDLTIRSNVPSPAIQSIWNNAQLELPSLPSFQLIDLRREPILGPDLLSAIKETLNAGQRVVILYNAHDRAVFIEREQRKDKIQLPGIETLKKRLAHLLGYSELPPSIYFGTRSILQEPRNNVGLAIALSLDPILPQLSSFTNTLHALADLGKLFSGVPRGIIQTKDAGHPLVAALMHSTIDPWLNEYITQQQAAHLPPFGEIIVASLPTDQPDSLSKDVFSSLQELIRDGWTISHPFNAPWRKKEFIHILLHHPEPKALLPTQLRAFLVKLPRPWRIQRNPWYLL